MMSAEAPSLPVDRTVADIRRRVANWRLQSHRIALVPTMGALHDGHLALIRLANASAEHTVVSIFVNPTQFSQNEDLDSYPRDERADLAALAELGVDAVFAPDAGEMYPSAFATTVSVSGPAEGLETDFRPHFFQGVTTIVAKLLIACIPDVAVFGEKDYQQLLVVRRMVADLGLPVEVVGQQTIRESDGLALSSRNQYLSEAERKQAPLLHQTLVDTAISIRSSEPVSEALAAAREALWSAGFRVDYVDLRDAETLAQVSTLTAKPMRLLAAARLGGTRLIDNVPV